MDKKYGAGKWTYAPAAIRAANITAATLGASTISSAVAHGAEGHGDTQRRPLHRTQSVPVNISVPKDPSGGEVRRGEDKALSRSTSTRHHGTDAVRRTSSMPVTVSPVQQVIYTTVLNQNVM